MLSEPFMRPHFADVPSKIGYFSGVRVGPHDLLGNPRAAFSGRRTSEIAKSEEEGA